MAELSRVKRSPDCWRSYVQHHYWPIDDQGVLPREAEPGYAIVACTYAEDGVTGDPEDIGPVQRVDVHAWSHRKGKRCAVICQDFDFPRTGWHVMGFVYPDGTVLTKEGDRLKSLEWWVEFVRAMRRAIAAGQRERPGKGGDTLVKLEPLPAEAFAARS